MRERQTLAITQQIALHPNRKVRVGITLPEMPPPPVFAEPAGPNQGLPLALAGLVNREFLATERWKDQQKRAVREGAHPKVLKFTDAVIRRFARVGIPMFPHAIVRTPEEQARLYETGVSRDSPADGIWPHKGCAVDLIHSVKGWNMNDDEWKLVCHLAQEVSDQMGLGMECGIKWEPNANGVGWDPAHWQLRKWKTLIGEYPWQTN